MLPLDDRILLACSRGARSAPELARKVTTDKPSVYSVLDRLVDLDLLAVHERDRWAAMYESAEGVEVDYGPYGLDVTVDGDPDSRSPPPESTPLPGSTQITRARCASEPMAAGGNRGPADVDLTDEQARIVEHDEGPAVVFAVAGSGKTTAMVRRIERLVREDVFAADEILATSFSQATAGDLEDALDAWPHCRDVDVRTIHSLGYRLLCEAPRGSRPLRPDRGGSLSGAERDVLDRTVRRARARGVDYEDELEDLDRRDFLAYLTECKGNLRYADLEAAGLPEEAETTASQARAPEGLDFYLDLYRLYEEVRREQGRVTYDDLLLGGWEALARSPGLRARAREWFSCVVVDEFQDVNLAQREILDAVAAPEYNYMVVGDDDQTIYEWRGARPEFILDFPDDYDAVTYRIQDNFRSPAPQLALANRVIEHNEDRVRKRLSLTRGFDGVVDVRVHEAEPALARAVVNQVKRARAHGFDLSEVAVLLRFHAQSAYLEHLLIQHGLPYEIAGGQPFYDRPAVRTLLAYVRLAQWEAAAIGDRGTTPPDGAVLPSLLATVANRSIEDRYIRARRIREVGRRAADEEVPIQQVLNDEARDAKPHEADGLRDLAREIAWLSRRLKRSTPGEVLDAFDERIGYRIHLRQTSGFDETGEARARNVTAFVDYAANAANLNQLVAHVDHLRETQTQASADDDALDVRTIHRAKGLEWPVVVLPHANDGTLPFARSVDDPKQLEEERRLAYVALTRSSHHTYVHVLEDQPVSRFLEQADHEATLDAVDDIEEVLSTSPRRLSPQDAVSIVRHVHALGLERYIDEWWQAPQHRQRSLARVALTAIRQADEEDLLDRLGVGDDERAFWEDRLGPADELPPGGLGKPVEGLLDGIPGRDGGVATGSQATIGEDGEGAEDAGDRGEAGGGEGAGDSGGAENAEDSGEADVGDHGEQADDGAPANAYQPWRPADDQALADLEEELTVGELAAKLGRSENAIRSRLRKIEAGEVQPGREG